MEIHQLEQFKTIAECRTMREAAEKLYLSQPALSQNLKKLEAELGCTLFDRSHNQLALTPYGEILLTHAHRILFDLKEVSEQIEQRKQEEARIIHVGNFYMPLNLFAMPQIANAMPNLMFQAIVGRAKDIAKKLIDGKLDIAFLPQRFCPAHLAHAEFCEETLLLSVPSTSPLVARETITREDLQGVSLLLPDGFPGLTLWYEEALRSADVPASQVERLPIKEYLMAMDGTDRAHFSTSLMSLFTGSKNVRPAIPVECSVSPRAISVAYDPANERAKPVADYIVEKRDELVSNHAFLPFLMYQGDVSNLSMSFEA